MNSLANIKAVPTPLPLLNTTEDIEEASLLDNGEVVTNTFESLRTAEPAVAVDPFRALFRVAELNFCPSAPSEAPRLMTCEEYVRFARRNVRQALGLPESAAYRQVRQYSGLPFLAPTLDLEAFEDAEYRETYQELQNSNLEYLLDRSYNGNYKMLLV